MSAIAEFQIPAAEFALSGTLSAAPRRVRDRRSSPTRPTACSRWCVQTDDAGALDAALAADPTVENVRLLAALAEERRYRMDRVANVETVVHTLLEHDSTVSSTSGRADGWHLRIPSPDRGSLSATYDFATDAGIDFALRNVLDLAERRDSQVALTEHQCQALLAAYEHGYYDIPRSVTLADLGGARRQRTGGLPATQPRLPELDRERTRYRPPAGSGFGVTPFADRSTAPLADRPPHRARARTATRLKCLVFGRATLPCVRVRPPSMTDPGSGRHDRRKHSEDERPHP